MTKNVLKGKKKPTQKRTPPSLDDDSEGSDIEVSQSNPAKRKISNILSPSILLLQFLMKINLMMPVPVLPPATVFYLQHPSIRHLLFWPGRWNLNLLNGTRAKLFSSTRHIQIMLQSFSVSLVNLYAILYDIVRFGLYGMDM